MLLFWLFRHFKRHCWNCRLTPDDEQLLLGNAGRLQLVPWDHYYVPYASNTCRRIRSSDNSCELY